MNGLIEWPAADRWLALTALTVAALASGVWLAAQPWRRSPAVRHLILLSGLLGCLAAPAVTGWREATDLRFLAIPVTGASDRPADTSSPSPPSGRHGNADRLPSEQAEDADPTYPLGALPDGLSVAAAQSPPTASKPQRSDLRQTAPQPTGNGAPAAVASGITLPAHAAWHWRLLLRWVWSAVSAVLLVRLAGNCVRVVRLRRGSRPCTDRRAVETLVAVADAAGIRRPRLLESDEVATPIAVGFGAPAVVLPAGFAASAGDAVLSDVLAHEVAHLRRRDDRVVLLQHVAAALFWPVVPVHLLNRGLRRAREEVCDIAALASGGSARDAVGYGHTLLRMAERATAGRRIVPAVGMAPRRGELERRIVALLDPRRSRAERTGRGPRLTATAVLTAASLLIGGTRLVTATAAAGDDEPPATVAVGSDGANSATDPAEAPMDPITWTEVPTVALEQPALHRGIVYGPDGQPLSGAKVYAGGSMDLLNGDRPHGAATAELGAVRAVTDAQGRFQFTAPDLDLPGRRLPAAA